MPPPTLTLVDCDLWNQFHHQQNEMIITKSGRCLFPALRLRAAGLIPTAEYSVHLDLEQLVPNRFKYCDGNWESVRTSAFFSNINKNTNSKFNSYRESYTHPDGMRSGSHWMKTPIYFNIKLSNEVFALKETSKNTPKDNPKETPEKISETAPKKTFEDLSEKMSEKIFEKNPEKAPERMHEKAPKEKSDMIPRELNIKIVKDSFMKSTVKSADDSPGRKSERNLGSIEPGASADKGTTDPSNSISRNITMVETGIFHVNSFHKYRPRIILRQHSDNSSRVLKEKTFKFDATTFMAVTHYQNEKVNDLKKLHNPHARGERGKTKPRKALQPIEEPMNHRHNITNNPIRKRPFSEQSSRVSKRARQNQSEEETSRSRAYHGMRSQGNQNGENELPQNPSYFNRQVQQNQTKEETPRSPAYRGLRFQGYQNSENEISQSTLYFNKRARQNQSEEETPQSLAYRGMRRHGSQNGENVTSQSPSSFNKRVQQNQSTRELAPSQSIDHTENNPSQNTSRKHNLTEAPPPHHPKRVRWSRRLEERINDKIGEKVFDGTRNTHATRSCIKTKNPPPKFPLFPNMKKITTRRFNLDHDILTTTTSNENDGYKGKLPIMATPSTHSEPFSRDQHYFLQMQNNPEKIYESIQSQLCQASNTQHYSIGRFNPLNQQFPSSDQQSLVLTHGLPTSNQQFSTLSQQIPIINQHISTVNQVISTETVAGTDLIELTTPSSSVTWYQQFFHDILDPTKISQDIEHTAMVSDTEVTPITSDDEGVALLLDFQRTAAEKTMNSDYQHEFLL